MPKLRQRVHHSTIPLKYVDKTQTVRPAQAEGASLLLAPVRITRIMIAQAKTPMRWEYRMGYFCHNAG